MRTRITIRYKTLEQFLQIADVLITPPDELYLLMNDCYLSPTECANDISTILNKYSKLCPFSLTIDFSYYSFPYGRSIQPIAEAIADSLKRGNYPKDLTINFKNRAIDDECVVAFADALASGNCHLPLTLELMYTCNAAMDALTNALTSGKCPRGLHLDISGATIGYQDVLKLSLALQHKNCPEDLHISLLYCGNTAAHFLSMVLQSGKCPRGLMLTLKNGDSDAIIMARAFKIGNIPANVALEFLGVTTEGASLVAKELEIAFNESKLLPGFNLIFRSSLINKKIMNRINEVLEKNEAKHAALACVAFQQGQRDKNHLISTLPKDILYKICSHTFFSAAHPFAKGKNSEEMNKKEQLFSKNLVNQFALKR